jgi:hypothetical protein
MLLDREYVRQLPFSPTSENRTVYYTRDYRIDSDGRLFAQTYRIVRVGTSIQSAPQWLGVFNSSIEILRDFNGRILHGDGKVESFSKSDLETATLANKSKISSQAVKFLPINKSVLAGDLVETVSLHEMAIPSLGIEFSLDELGMDADNITCTIQNPGSRPFPSLVINDTLHPVISCGIEHIMSKFHWEKYSQDNDSFIFGKRNNAPGVLAAILPMNDSTSHADSSQPSWREFGDRYLELIRNRLQWTQVLADTARKITEGKNTQKEKMDAIFDYCQHSVRYAQVYLERGEFIPNDCDLIFSRKFGDCKDYALLMYCMARSVGVDADLALCFRGRNHEFHPKIPVSQFNHMIAHYAEGGKDYWYDGTNRAGLAGITTMDLCNATALVLVPGDSHLARISESADNLLAIRGTLQPQANSLRGTIVLELSGQYCIDFFWADLHATPARMMQFIASWVQKEISGTLTAADIRWEKCPGKFIITLECDIPNALTSIPPAHYCTIAHVLNAIAPDDMMPDRIDDVFDNPRYGNVDIVLTLEGAAEIFGDAGISSRSPCQMAAAFHLPQGPFYSEQRTDFARRYSIVRAELNKPHKLMGTQ